MKRIYILFIISILILSGCEKFLDKKPETAYDSEFTLTTIEGMDLLLNGTYSLLSGRYYYGFLLYAYEASKGPDFFVRNVSGGASLLTECLYAESSTSNGNAKNAWKTIYQVIRNSTYLLDNIDSIPGDIEEIRRVKGEASALRGLAYFDLMRMFAYPPIFSCSWGTKYDPSFKYGVPIIKDVEMGSDILDYEIERQTADSTYKFIESQMTLAANLLKGKVCKEGHVDHATALALLIRISLYMQKWDKVIEYGEEWISLYDGKYNLIPYESYKTNYYKTFNQESIWELNYPENNNLSSYSLNYWVRRPTYNDPESSIDGQVSEYIGYAKLGFTYGNSSNGLNFIQRNKTDVRSYLVCELGITGKDYRGCRKYVGNPNHYIHNIPIVRLPEIYLSLSEAYFNTGDKPSATEYASKVSLVRRKAATSVSALTDVLNERRMEFFLEGQTYWDMFRTATNIRNRQIIESIDDASITFGSTTGASYRTVYPIPLAEMNANPAIRNQQNPGYAEWTFAIDE